MIEVQLTAQMAKLLRSIQDGIEQRYGIKLRDSQAIEVVLHLAAEV